MSRRTGRQSQGFGTRRKGQIVVAGVVVVSLFAAWTMLASSGALDSAFRQKNNKGKTISPASLNSNTPSKEFIYSGGRLICTEEATSSTLSAPANLRATTSSSTQIHITWNAVTGAARYELQRTSNYGNPTDHGFSTVSSNITTTAFDDTPTTGIATGNAYIYQVRAFDSPSGGNSSPFSNIDLATAITFTDDPATTVTTVREVHVTQLRQAVDAVRVASGLSAAAWTDPPPLAQIVNIKKVHIDQLRSNLDGARSALALPAPTYTDPTIVQFSTQVRAAHIQELRQLVKGYRTVTG
jgi:hypothetical protein